MSNENYKPVMPKVFDDFAKNFDLAKQQGDGNLDGRFFCLEIKNEKGRLRPDQKLFAQFIKPFPVLYGVARSVDDALTIVGGD